MNAPLRFGGVALVSALPALRALEPAARAAWIYDLDAFADRVRRFRAAFAPLAPLTAMALKSNPLPALLESARAGGLGAEAGSLGELALAEALGFEAGARVLNGNGRTPEEAAWVARLGVHSVNADHLGELDLLETAAAEAGASVRVALRVNPAIDAGGHPFVATGGDDAKFGVAPGDALAAWAARARWPHLVLDGLHLHVGSQLLDLAPLERSLETALALAAESAARGAPLALLNLGGGFGVDYVGASEFPLETWAAVVARRTAGLRFEWVLEPGRWLTAPVGALLAEVVAVKRRGDQRFVVLSAGMNDLIRPALYGARHRIVPLRPRTGGDQPATVVGPVCESSDVFATALDLPLLEPGDPVAILDAGAYGAAMASNYNGRGRLAELAAAGGTLTRVRAGETPEALLARRTSDRLALRSDA